MSEYAVAQYGRRSCVLPEGVVYWTTGSRTYPTAHETGEDVDAMLPRSTESAKTEKTLASGSGERTGSRGGHTSGRCARRDGREVGGRGVRKRAVVDELRAGRRVPGDLPC